MTRFPLLALEEIDDPEVQAIYAEIARDLGYGMVPNLFRSMASDPDLLRANWGKFRATVLQGGLPRTVKEMIGIVVSMANGSEYARQVSTYSLGMQGVLRPVLEALAEGSLVTTDLPEKTRAVLGFAQSYTANKRVELDPLFAAMRGAGCDDAEILEAIATIDLFESVNAWTDLVGVEVDQLS